MKKIFGWIANNFFGLIELLVFLGTCIYAFLNKVIYHYNFSILEIVLILVIVVQFIVYFIVVIRNIVSYKSYHYNWLKIRTNYEFKKKIVKYKVDENDNLIFKREAEVKSNINNCDFILDKFIWTGSSEAQFPTKGRNVQEIREQRERKGVWKFFDIVLDMPISKGKSREISYKWPIISNCSSSSPFVSQSTEEPTRYVKFEIDLGTDYANKEIILEEYRAIDANIPLNIIEGEKFDDRGRYVWEIKKPKRFRYYIARWNWNK